MGLKYVTQIGYSESRFSSSMKPVLIDHYDSFTHILGQYIGKIAGEMPPVLQHDKTSLEEIRKHDPTHIILSPGPGTVLKKEDFAIGNKILDHYANTSTPTPPQIPILGVCLGHHGIGAYYGTKIVHAPEVMHGKRSQVTHNGTGLFTGIPSPLTVMRYHSLIVEPKKLPACLEITAKTKTSEPTSEPTSQSTNHIIMAIRHKDLPVFGVQFHPESVGTEHGMKLLSNFLQTQ